MVRTLTEKMGPAAPALVALREALDNCHTLMQDLLRRKRSMAPPLTDSSEEPAGAQEASGVRTSSSRAEVYQQLAQAAARLRDLEPHSPIPYLLQRAVELGSLPFPQLIRALIRDDGVLNELNRELGIKEPPGEG